MIYTAPHSWPFNPHPRPYVKVSLGKTLNLKLALCMAPAWLLYGALEKSANEVDNLNSKLGEMTCRSD